MKVLFVETQLTGHHFTYLKALVDACGVNNAFIVAPADERIPQNYRGVAVSREKGLAGYLKWLKLIARQINKEKPDVVHFLYGDDLYRYGGIGLGLIKRKAKIIVTCHQVRRSKLRDVSLKNLSRNASTIVVHTLKLKNDLNKLGIDNVEHIEYPQFSCTSVLPQVEALKQLGIHPIGKVILALGGTRYDKGLDLLIDAIKEVKGPYHLIIAGTEEYFKKTWIDEKIAEIHNNVSIFIEYLSDEKFSLCLNAADIICLPYRKAFDGASGPLGEGVALGKMIVGASHGSLGQIIECNHLGRTFESENVRDLANQLSKALSENWKPDEKYTDYQRELSPIRFQKEYLHLYE